MTSNNDKLHKQFTSEEVNKAIDTSQWLDKSIIIPVQMRELLSSYSGLTESQLVSHVTDIRDRAFQKYPYPSIGQLRFLDLNLSRHPYYLTALARVKSGQKFLDIGCCFAQDFRKLAHDGAPSENLYGIDIEPAFFELGYEMFRDKAKFRGHLFAIDMLNHNDSLPQLDGTIDMISMFSFMHFFTLQQQADIMKKTVKFLCPSKGVNVFGRQLGASVGRAHPGMVTGMDSYIHGPSTFREQWETMGRDTQTSWNVEVYQTTIDPKMKSLSWAYEGMSWLYFTVTRL